MYACLVLVMLLKLGLALESGETYPCGSTEEEASFPIREYLEDSAYSPSWNTTVLLVSPHPIPTQTPSRKTNGNIFVVVSMSQPAAGVGAG